MVGGIASFVFYIIAIVKCFKAGDTLWGVLTIFLGIPGLIWLFMNGQKNLGIMWVLAIVASIVGSVLAGAGLAAMGTAG